MAKFQLCEFRRTSKLFGPSKADNLALWEKGIARVGEYNESNQVEFIIDEDGNKLTRVYQYRLLSGLAYTVIDTAVKQYSYC